ncbi:MAG: TetR/AcrR family transcriptional regulator [Actinomycetota bacterium]
MRRDILSAAEQLILEEGLGAATTKAIARMAGCAEGSIYRHFPDKDALVVEVVRTSFPEFLEILCTLPERVGRATVKDNLTGLATVALGFYRGILPLAAGVVSDQELLIKNRVAFAQTDSGPQKALLAVAGYLEAEQAIGRVGAHVRPPIAARILLGTLFAQAFFELLTGEQDENEQADQSMIAEAVETLARAWGLPCSES